MRTTIRMNEALARGARQLARDTGRTFTDVIEEAVTELLAKPPAGRPRKKVVLPTYGGSPKCVAVRPGPKHWAIFDELCRKSNAAGKLLSDACYAALAIEGGYEWATSDRDYAKFPGLTWRHPLRGKSVANPL